MPHQVDMAWYYIRFMNRIGAISSYKDSKKQFFARYHQPYLEHKLEFSRTPEVVEN